MDLKATNPPVRWQSKSYQVIRDTTDPFLRVVASSRWRVRIESPAISRPDTLAHRGTVTSPKSAGA